MYDTLLYLESIIQPSNTFKIKTSRLHWWQFIYNLNWLGNWLIDFQVYIPDSFFPQFPQLRAFIIYFVCYLNCK